MKTTNYFEAISIRCEELDKLGEEYLSKFEFLDNEEVCNRIWKAANAIFKAKNEDWDAVPEWVASTLDGGIPYAGNSRNGSIYYSLGLSVVSRDAHLRNLLEIAEGRETEELSFAVLAEKEIVNKYCGL